ncbi:MAG: hypothetical protein A2Z34_05660 [Planctomycetes bacterium RBG_16_59_8]|nr:MAG: hypothetical protein A2Z34_05660 [Planctomycetes bacterium RBG_16_59_8]
MGIEKKIIDAYKRFRSVMKKSGVERFAIIGGIATKVHSNPPATDDLDILVEARANDLSSAMKSAGYRIEIPSGETSEWFPAFFAHDPNGVRLDVFVALREFDHEVLMYSVNVKRDNVLFTVASVEHVLLYKFVAMREKDEGHIRLLVDGYRAVLDVDYLRRWSRRLGVDDVFFSYFPK